MGVSEVIEELENKLGRHLDLNEETYYLQTPTALVKLGFEENDGVVFEVVGGESAVFVETEKDIFKNLFIEGDN